MSSEGWTDDVEKVLELIRQNSVLLATFHKKKYYEYKGWLKYFKLPMIVLTSITSIASMGLTNYMKQDDISLLTCLLSLGSALIASIELYLGIQKSKICRDKKYKDQLAPLPLDIKPIDTPTSSKESFGLELVVEDK